MPNKHVKIIDNGYQDFLKGAESIANAEVQVGYFGDPVEGSNELTYGQLAAIHLFGAPKRHIPARDWITPVIDGKAAALGEAVEDVVVDVTKGIPVEESAYQFGERVVGMFKRSLTDLRSPPLKPETIERKGSSNPLIDTGALRDHTEARLYIRGVRVR